jgi:ArsR family transcriptional regulator, arsenate/arsenite/antimonite-responsive transcriptional repressor
MEISSAVSALSALAHPHRLAVFRLLVRLAPEGVPAGDIAGHVGMSPTAASFHLKELDRAGLVHATRDGRHIRYAAHIEGVRALITFLTEDCCQGRADLCGGTIVDQTVCCSSPAGVQP